MRILFNLLTTIEIPNADVFPPREEVTNYAVSADEQKNIRC